jgi:hypothetical protein
MNAGILILALVLLVALSLVVWQSGTEAERADAPPADLASTSRAETADELEEELAGDEPAEAAAPAPTAAEDGERVAAPAKPEATPKPVTGVRGRVLDRDEKPVAEALVLLAPEAGTAPWPLDARGPQGMFEPLRGRTDAKGRFQIEETPVGGLRLAVRKPGYAPLDVEELTVALNDVSDLGDLTLLPTAVLSGVVLDRRDAPVPGARLYSLGELLPGHPDELSADNGALVATADELGLFEIHTLRPGRWRLLVASERHPEQVFEGFVDPLDGREDGLELRLDDGASISGRVLGAEGELPLFVYAVPQRFVQSSWRGSTLPDFPETLAGYRSAEVGDLGDFELTGLTPNEPYNLRLRKRGQSVASPDPFSKVLDVRAGVRDVELEYEASAGLALEAVDGVKGGPVEKFTVSIAGTWPATMSDGEGHPREHHPGGVVAMNGIRPTSLDRQRPFPDLLESPPCIVSIQSLGYEHVEVEDVLFKSGQTTDLGQVRLSPLPVLRLVAVDDVTDEPVDRARVYVRKAPFARQGRTGRDGRIELSFPLEGSARVTVSARDYDAFSEDLPVSVCSLVDPYEVRLQSSAPGPGTGNAASRLATVEVLARDYARQPLIFHEVWRGTVPRPRRGGGITSMSVDAEGRALFLDTGETYDYALHPRPRLGHIEPVEPLWQRITSRLGEVTTVTLLDRALERLHGRVYLNGRPLADARLRVMEGSESLDQLTEEWQHGHARSNELNELGYSGGGGGLVVRGGFASGRTDRDGRFAFEGVVPGTYSILVDHPASGIRTRRVVQAGPSELAVDIGDTEISGVVRDESGAPVEGAPVHFVVTGSMRRELRIPRGTPLAILGRGRAPFATTYSDHRGQFRIDAVPPDLQVSIIVRAGGLVGGRWWVYAKRGESVYGQDVTVARVASLDVHVESENPNHRFAVLLFNPARPVGLGTFAGRVEADGVARFGDLDPGSWHYSVVFVDEFDRVSSSAEWQAVTLNPGEHHELGLED